MEPAGAELVASAAAAAAFHPGEPVAPRLVRRASYLSEEQAAKCRALPLVAGEVWQVVVCRLRCFVPGDTKPLAGTPVRPHCVLVLSLHPAGRLVCKQVVRPPEAAPATPTVLEQVVRGILDPAAEGAPPGVVLPPAHRPATVSFADPELAAACAHSLAAIGVAATVRPCAPQVPSIVRQLSAFLLTKGAARGSPAGEQPGMLRVPGVTLPLVRAFLRLCLEFTARQPWGRIAERQLFRVTGAPVPDAADGRAAAAGGGGGAEPPSGRLPPAVAWVGVVGNRSMQERQRAAAAGAPPPPPMRGLSLFFKRYDAEYRLLCTHGQPPGGDGPLAPVARAAVPAAVANPLDMVCARPACGRTRGASPRGSDLLRCSRCKEVYYCDRDCQAGDFQRHVGDCKRWEVPEPGASGHWGRRELVLLLENPFQMPHDDHEVLEELALAPGDPMAHPVPLRFSASGQPARPSVSDLVWLMRGMATVMAMMDAHPRECVDIRPMTLPAALDLTRATNDEHWYDAAASAHDADEPAAAAASAAAGGAAAAPDAAGAGAAFTRTRVSVRTDPILTKDEHTQLHNAIAAAEAAEAKAKAGGDGSGGGGGTGLQLEDAAAGGGDEGAAAGGRGGGGSDGAAAASRRRGGDASPAAAAVPPADAAAAAAAAALDAILSPANLANAAAQTRSGPAAAAVAAVAAAAAGGGAPSGRCAVQ